ncbi:MAG TPA: tRNA (guanosine(37)-N1)-methyltransferase TrmD [Chloroflexota bacterium]|nr:tRNA (guanosine(37)-N1)-methyltransferase TrmD [Chloroflexota bacterium]
MRIDVLTLFPAMFGGPFDESIVARARAAGLLDLRIHNLRDWSTDRHRTVDDYPYGGGAGMVLKAEPVVAAVESLRGTEGHVVLLTPQGEVFRQQTAATLAGREHLVLVCGHYEGVDERIREHAVDQEVSIGDYVLSGGELPAMVLVDAVVRLLPGALGSPLSAVDESHSAGLLEYPQYTRPAEFRGWRVPDVLLSGHHAEIARWRREQALRRTRERRPDLLPHPTDSPHPTDAPHPPDDPGAAAILAPESTEQTSHA